MCFISFQSINAQNVQIESGKKYTINEIVVTGNTSFNASTIITFSRLKKGDEVILLDYSKVASKVG